MEQKIKWEEFRKMKINEEDRFIYELVDGEAKNMVFSKAPTHLDGSKPHQRASRRLTEALGEFLKKNRIGEYFYAPTDVYLDDDNGVVPDISFVSKERDFLIENGDYIAGAPDLIVEIISPGSVKRDRVEKKELYERFSVKEFWLIDPANRTVEIYLMENDTYRLHAFLEEEGKLKATTAEGFEFEISELFA